MPDRPAVTFIGTLPPPFTGMTISSSNVIDHLRERTDLRIWNLSSKVFNKGMAWKLTRFVKYKLVGLRLLISKKRKDETLYIVANAGFGLWYDIGLAIIARLRGYRVLLQHRSYSYIWKYDFRMAIVNRLMGQRGVHVCLCHDMITRFKGVYDARCDTFRLPNSLLLEDTGWQEIAHHKSKSDHLRIGHISNLSIEKGLKIVIDTFDALRKQGVEAELILAGGCATYREKELVKWVIKEHGESVKHLGPVYGEDKWRFFRDVDLMLFPTMYRTEAQPRVVLEAMTCGVPVITFDRACIGQMIGETSEGGLCIAMDDDFVRPAVEKLKEWAANPKTLWRQKTSAAKHGLAFHEAARKRLDDFVEMIGEG